MSILTTLFGRKPNPVQQPVTEVLVLDEIVRAARFRRAWDAYYGRFPKPLKVRPNQPDDNVPVNFARVVVDKSVSFLFGQDVEFELDEAEKTEAEQWLAECWAANRKMTTLQKLALNGAVCGHVFVKVVARQPYPRLVVLDPATVDVRWQPDDIEAVTSYRVQYQTTDSQTGKTIDFRQTIDRDGQVWRITDQVSREGSVQWETISESVWPYSWPPIADCQNLPAPNEYWGVPDLEDDVLQLNLSINFVLSNLIRIVRYHAHPKTWGRGFTANQLNVAVDETIVLPSPDAELRNLEMVSDLSSSIALYERLREALHEVTRVPEVATGKLDRAGALSGVALSILYQPLIEKTETKRRTYGDLLVELNRRLLALGGFGEENQTVLHWPELLPGDPKAEAETALLQQQLGVSQDTLLQRMGFDPDLERQKHQVSAQHLGEQMLTAFERGQ
ncbi:MAG: phage portal protein [Anaerolineae bacterium]